jgi:hypothetical protein
MATFFPVWETPAIGCMGRDKEEAPLEHDVFRNRPYALFEHWPHFVR